MASQITKADIAAELIRRGSLTQEQAAQMGYGLGAPKTGPAGKLSPTDAKVLQSIDEAAAESDHASQLARQFNRLNMRTGTEPFYKPDSGADQHHNLLDAWGLPQMIGRSFNPVSSNPDLAGMNSITQQMAPALRTPGMRLTQMEFGAFRGAVPNVSISSDANAEIVREIHHAAAYNTAKQAFYRSWASSHGNLDDVTPAWQRFKSTRFDGEGAYVHQQPPAAAPASAPARAPASSGPGAGFVWGARPVR